MILHKNIVVYFAFIKWRKVWWLYLL